jgi:hypothetical protein
LSNIGPNQDWEGGGIRCLPSLLELLKSLLTNWKTRIVFEAHTHAHKDRNIKVSLSKICQQSWDNIKVWNFSWEQIYLYFSKKNQNFYFKMVDLSTCQTIVQEHVEKTFKGITNIDISFKFKFHVVGGMFIFPFCLSIYVTGIFNAY